MDRRTRADRAEQVDHPHRQEAPLLERTAGFQKALDSAQRLVMRAEQLEVKDQERQSLCLLPSEEGPP